MLIISVNNPICVWFFCAIKIRIIILRLIIIWACPRCSINSGYCGIRLIRGADIVNRIIKSVSWLAELSRNINFCLIIYHSWTVESKIFISLAIFFAINKSLKNAFRWLSDSWGWIHYPLFNYLICRFCRNLTKIFLLVPLFAAYRLIIAVRCGPLTHGISDAAFADLSDRIRPLRHAA